MLIEMLSALGLSLSSTQIQKVGIIPTSFPRDPIQFEFFLEHTVYGQITRPLVEVDSEGMVIPGVARSWTVSADAKTFWFEMDRTQSFPDGRNVTSEDAKFSIERHVGSQNSQIGSFLKVIDKIEAIDELHLKITLTHPSPDFLKALSRDQLGILPHGWIFDPTSLEPFLGTGSYRLILETGADATVIKSPVQLGQLDSSKKSNQKSAQNWYLIARTAELRKSPNAVKVWKLIFGDAGKWDQLPELPDALPWIDESVWNELKQHPQFPASEKLYLETPLNHFAQTIAWWIGSHEKQAQPHGTHPQSLGAHQESGSSSEKIQAEDTLRRLRIMNAVDQLIQRAAKNYTLSTGFIPRGLPGALHTRPKPILSETVQSNRSMKITAKVLVLRNFLNLLNDQRLLSGLFEEFGVKLELAELDFKTFEPNSKNSADVIISAFAGGFQAPEGFLLPLTSLIKRDYARLLGEHYSLYTLASREPKWEKRAQLFSKLARALTETGYSVPGWKLNIKSIRKNHL